MAAFDEAVAELARTDNAKRVVTIYESGPPRKLNVMIGVAGLDTADFPLIGGGGEVSDSEADRLVVLGAKDERLPKL